MNEVLIVPDIHGRKFWEPALDYPGEVIFLGDYTDPYAYEGFNQEDACRALQKIVAYKMQNPDRVTLLIGNHELHYYDKQFRCSRFDEMYYERYHAILTGETTAGLFQVCKQKENYLFIHAGITKGWYDLHADELQSLGDCLEEQINRLFRQRIEAFYEASRYRGGFSEHGSPLWADVQEHFSEAESFNDLLTQVIGHTQLTGDAPFIREHIRLLDNRRLYLLRNDTFEEYGK
ncbi:MAG: metallophosphoesterase [Tannerella sp.]|jgi:hypothetical protein|nr:metallophosphoesterase [Tannerella sp.]